MHRFYLPPAAWQNDILQLEGTEAHHCQNVLRLESGSKVTLFDGLGTEAQAIIRSAGKHSVQLEVGPKHRTPALPCAITLAQAIPKGKNMELIIQKAVELGATRIIPLLSERTVIQLDENRGEKRREKWQQTAVEACKQCGQNWLPQVLDPCTPAEYFDRHGDDALPLIASLQPGARHLKHVLADYETERGALPKSAGILIGPEGDFTPAEASLAISRGCSPITLGPIILRTETAAIYCLSVLSHELLNPLAKK